MARLRLPPRQNASHDAAAGCTQKLFSCVRLAGESSRSRRTLGTGLQDAGRGRQVGGLERAHRSKSVLRGDAQVSKVRSAGPLDRRHLMTQLPAIGADSPECHHFKQLESKSTFLCPCSVPFLFQRRAAQRPSG